MIYVNASRAIASLRQYGEALDNAQFSKAVSRAINETIKQGRTEARKSIKDLYNIPQRYIRDGDKIENSTTSQLYASLAEKTTPIPMDAFDPIFHTATQAISVSRRGRQKVRGLKKKETIGQGVSIEVKKGKRETIPYAFMVANAKPRVFARGEYKVGNTFGFVQRHTRLSNTGNDLPIKPLLSVTVHAAAINPKSLMEHKVNDAFPEVLRRNISFMLSRLNA